MADKKLDLEKKFSEKSQLIKKKGSNCCQGVPKRWNLAILGFFGFFNVAAMRVNLNVAMVAMVLPPAVSNIAEYSETTCAELLPSSSGNSSIVPTQVINAPQFDWDATTQSAILGAFYYGYIVLPIPGGILADKYGAKWLYAIGVLIPSLLTLLTPISASIGVWALITVRVLEGLFEGIITPCMNNLIGRWAPTVERSRISTIAYSGNAIGNVISFSLSGYISATLGWPFVFYVFGSLGFLWSIFWLLLVYDSPESHPTITQEELLYIRDGIEHDKNLCFDTRIPWKSILSSPFVWTLAITLFGSHWSTCIILIEFPTYLSNILHFDLKENGVLSALPHLALFILGNLGSMVADKMRASQKFKINTIRKLFNSLAFFFPAACMFAVSFIGCERISIITLLCLSTGFVGLNYSGCGVTHIDMSPDFAGILMGISYCIANISGFLAPAMVGFVTRNGQTIENWRIVFLTSSAILVITGLIYIFFCTAEQQVWGKRNSIIDCKNSGNGKSQPNKTNQPQSRSVIVISP